MVKLKKGRKFSMILLFKNLTSILKINKMNKVFKKFTILLSIIFKPLILNAGKSQWLLSSECSLHSLHKYFA